MVTKEQVDCHEHVTTPDGPGTVESVSGYTARVRMAADNSLREYEFKDLTRA